MKKVITTNIIILFCLISYSQMQTNFVEHSSVKYKYKVSVPSDFSKETPKGSNIDLKFVYKDGTNITINVSARLEEEYSITAHDYTKEMLQESFTSNAEKTFITYSEKIIISGQNAFLVEFIDAFQDIDLKVMQCFFFYNNLAFVITCTSETKNFTTYKPMFLKSIKSINL